MDADGDNDIVVGRGLASPAAFRLENLGSGNFSTTENVIDSSSNSKINMVVDDFDKNGFPDVWSQKREHPSGM